MKLLRSSGMILFSSSALIWVLEAAAALVEKPRLTVPRWRGSGALRIRYRLRKCPVQKITMKNKMGSEYPAWRVAAAPP